MPFMLRLTQDGSSEPRFQCDQCGKLIDDADGALLLWNDDYKKLPKSINPRIACKQCDYRGAQGPAHVIGTRYRLDLLAEQFPHDSKTHKRTNPNRRFTEFSLKLLPEVLFVGITRETLHQWRNDPEFKEFSDAIKSVQAKRLLNHLFILHAVAMS